MPTAHRSGCGDPPWRVIMYDILCDVSAGMVCAPVGEAHWLGPWPCSLFVPCLVFIVLRS